MARRPERTVEENYLKRIEKKVEDLKNLFAMSALISSTLDLNELMQLVMEKARNALQAEACSILFYNRETDKLEFEVALCSDKATSEMLTQKIILDVGQGIAGWVAQNLVPLIIDDVKKDNRFCADIDKQTGFVTESIVAVPLIGRGGLIGVAELLNPRRKDYDAELFEILCRQFAIAIENALLHKKSIEKERLRQELEIASELQKSFLPSSPFLKKGNVSISAINISAAQVGGDLYDFIEPAENTVGVIIGDVSGKGVSGALYMSKIISDFKYLGISIDSPDVVLNRLNALLSDAPHGMYLTAVYIIIDSITGAFRVSAAGHPPFLLITKDEVRVMDVLSGPPLGILPAEYPFTLMSLAAGDRLFLFTDGVFEAKNKSGERIGFDNLVEFVRRHKDTSRLSDMVVNYVKDFSKGTEMADDLTMVEIAYSNSLSA
ncbi:MAG: GAF domain-containing SpoIIE family protein phosphatase [Dissulfurispiraceae bacterium]|jgi:sigma-B regulation protein RsbU (phosphoserine phosphatase)